MPVIESIVAELTQRLESFTTYGYRFGGPAASEPTALAAYALMAAGKNDAARTALNWLRDTQAQDGSVGVTREEQRPAWPTSLAMAAWNHFQNATSSTDYVEPITNGRMWLMQTEGHTMPRPSKSSHDTTLLGWPWAEGTHSWLEPTAFCVLSLKAIGERDHARTREAVKLLLDRQLPGGGCNYGNTFVLGQTMKPHIQPTGIALLAFAGEPPDPRVEATLKFLQREWPKAVGTASVCFAAMGLSAFDRTPDDLSERLSNNFNRLTKLYGEKIGAYKLALMSLAAMGEMNPLINRA